MTPIGHVPTNFILFLNFSSTVVISVLKCVKSSYTPHPEPELSAVHLSLETRPGRVNGSLPSRVDESMSDIVLGPPATAVLCHAP